MSDEQNPEDRQQAADLMLLEQQAAEGAPEHAASVEAQGAEIPTADLIRPAVAMLARMATYSLPPEVQDSEIELLTQSYADTLDHYFPDLNFPKWAAPIITTAIVFGPRYAEHMARAKHAPEPGREKEPEPTEPEPGEQVSRDVPDKPAPPVMV